MSKLATAWNHGHPRPKMNILVHFWAASLQANLLLRRTTAIRGGSAMNIPVHFWALFCKPLEIDIIALWKNTMNC